MNFLKNWFKKKEISSIKTGIAAVRREYLGPELNEENVGSDPIQLFETWYEEASQKVQYDVNAMVLSTINENKPESRVVLLKGFDESGFVFYTNYNSDKGQQIDSNNQVALIFYWAETFRQVRINGKAVKVDSQTSDEYFNSRPIESRLSAIASPQSQMIPNRIKLEELLQKTRQQWKERDPVRPENWGGYLVIPDKIEFWQGRTGRLHDRIKFQLSEDKWVKSRLAP